MVARGRLTHSREETSTGSEQSYFCVQEDASLYLLGISVLNGLWVVGTAWWKHCINLLFYELKISTIKFFSCIFISLLIAAFGGSSSSQSLNSAWGCRFHLHPSTFMTSAFCNPNHFPLSISPSSLEIEVFFFQTEIEILEGFSFVLQQLWSWNSSHLGSLSDRRSSLLPPWWPPLETHPQQIPNWSCCGYL